MSRTGTAPSESADFKYMFFYKHNVYKHTEAQISKKLSIFQAYFEAGFVKNLSIFEPQFEKHYA